MTIPQLKLMRERMREKSLDWTETQAAIVWSMYAGKWSRKSKGSTVAVDENESLQKFREMGMVTDG